MAETQPSTESQGRFHPDLLPVRMLNEAVYCPRLFALEHLNQEWADSGDTVRGRTVHKRVDEPGRTVMPEVDEGAPKTVRSVHLGDPALGLVARIDLVEAQEGRAIPIDYKKGRKPDVPEGAWEPERVQVCAQGLLLRAHGYQSDHGLLYFAESKDKVEVAFSEGLISSTLEHLAAARRIMEAGVLPEPLVNSPRCWRCSLNGICLPDEQNLLSGKAAEVRPLLPPRDDGVPVYAVFQGGAVGLDHEELVLKDRGQEVGRARLAETSRLVVMGNVSVTTPLLRELADRDVPVSFHSFGGWFWGLMTPASGRNVLTRIAQFRAALDPARALGLSRVFVHSKILNSRVLLRRNLDVPEERLQRFKEIAEDALKAPSLDVLLGLEGGAARMYFELFGTAIRNDLRETFHFDQRNRRPPRDPVNALLSFAYACLARELTNILHGIGMDPFVGFLHQPRYGRPSLALDLMEEFRPVLADSVVLRAINTSMVTVNDFVIQPTGVALTDGGRRRFIQAWEHRLDELATHPTFETRLSYRRILEVQARLLGKHLLGDLEAYPEYRVR